MYSLMAYSVQPPISPPAAAKKVATGNDGQLEPLKSTQSPLKKFGLALAALAVIVPAFFVAGLLLLDQVVKAFHLTEPAAPRSVETVIYDLSYQNMF